MACIVWKRADGTTYLVGENVAHKPSAGAFNTGAVDWTCGNNVQAPQNEADAMLEAEGLKIGDAIAWVTKKIGLKQCAPCKARQEILNNATKNGWAATIKAIKETLT